MIDGYRWDEWVHYDLRSMTTIVTVCMNLRIYKKNSGKCPQKITKRWLKRWEKGQNNMCEEKVCDKNLCKRKKKVKELDLCLQKSWRKLREKTFCLHQLLKRTLPLLPSKNTGTLAERKYVDLDDHLKKPIGWYTK